ncbi:MAG: ATP-binding cassette domain-containing protein, partial [Clostridiales bacterium]|nr:ATP-binding cassette domain-containing protein [Clostridiales bacterium]
MKPVKLSVRRIIEFVLRAGDIDNRFRDSSAMYKGVAAHRKIQKESGENYKKEVTLTLETEIENIPIILKGRADGIITDENGVIIDEIKTTALPLEHFYKQENLHYGQGMVYAHMYLQTCETRYSAAKVQLTYFQLESEEIQRHEKIFTRDELSEFFNNLLKQYGFWLKLERDWKITRNLSISETNFPFETYRKGQRELAVAVYRTISAGKKLYVSAPTGIGKTLSAIFPSIKSLEKGMADKIFYLTAKTVTRTVAEDAVKMLTNLRIKTITLRAKEKICTNEIFSCNPENCASAKGHFDRVNSALADLITNNDLITPAAVAEYAQKHNVCPHEFSLDAALHCDIIIGDYNHVFDPVVYLKRFFENVGGEYIFLIDEAHNLVDRVRDMHSAALRKSAFSGVKVRDKNPFAKNLRIGYLAQQAEESADCSVWEDLESVFAHVFEMEKKLRAMEAEMASPNADEAAHERLLSQYAILTDAFEEADGYAWNSAIQGVLSGLGFTRSQWDQQVSLLSGGERTRLRLARLLLQKPDILLLDEPTNHVDVSSLEWLENYLKNYKKTVIIISHDRYFLDNVVTQIIEIENKRAYSYSGNYSAFVNKKAEDREIRQKHFELQQREIQRIEEMIARLRAWGGKKKIIQAKSKEKMLDRMEKVER